MPSKPKDKVGERYGRLVVIAMAENQGGKYKWLCQCDCGKEKIATGSNLKTGATQSCGCLQKEKAGDYRRANARHGAARFGAIHPLHNRWSDMLDRCYNPKNPHYNRYGGRGIGVYKHWHKYENFRDYMLALPNCPDNIQIPRANIDREIDRYPNNDGHYEPGNVRWATRIEQQNNRENNKIFDVNGKKMTLAQIVEKHSNLSYDVVYARLSIGWSLKRALIQPIRKK